MSSSSAVASVMQHPVRTFRADLPAIDALQFAERCGMHHLPLLAEGKITGLVCTCDLQDLELQAPISDAVTRDPATIPAQSTVDQAVRTMSEQEVGSLLVTQDGGVVGIVTREDLFRAGIQVDDAPGFRCECCGSVKHLRSEGGKGTLCMDCRARAQQEVPGDGTGVGD